MVDPYEAELAEQAARGGSGSTLGMGFDFSPGSRSTSSNVNTSNDESDGITFSSGDDYVPGQGIKISSSTLAPSSVFDTYGGRNTSAPLLEMFGGSGQSFSNSMNQGSSSESQGIAAAKPEDKQGFFNRILGTDFDLSGIFDIFRSDGRKDQTRNLEFEAPKIDGSALLSGILSPALEQLKTGKGSGRLLDQVMQTASNFFNRPQETKVEPAPASDKNRADELIRDTIRNAAQGKFTSGQAFDLDQVLPPTTFERRPEVNLRRGPKTIQDPTSAVPSQIEINQRPLQRDQGIMDALRGGARDGVNPPSVAGLANIPTQQVADASTSEFLNKATAKTINDLFETFQKGPRSIDLGPGELKFSVDPFGEERSIGGTYTMPLQDLGIPSLLGGLLSQNQAQQPASDAFQVADTSMLGNYMKQGNLKSQGGGFFGSDGGGARYYQFGTGGSSRPSRSSRGDASVFDKMLQMFKFDPNRGAGKFG